MPWDVKKDRRCPSSRPWGVVKQGDKTLEGCHVSQVHAERQQAALYANEPSSRRQSPMARSEEDNVDDVINEEVELGGGDAVSFCRATFDGSGMEIQDSDASMPMLVGKFASYGNWNEIYSPGEAREMGLRGDRYMERVLGGAFTKTLQERAGQIRLLFNHGLDPSVGKKPLGEIVEVEEQEDGPHYRAKLFDASYVRDLIPALRANQFGSSYRSDLVKGKLRKRPGDSEHNPEGLPEATVAEVRLKEFGPVTFPAEAKATAGVRSLTDWARSEDLALALRRMIVEEPIVQDDPKSRHSDDDEQPDPEVEAVRATAVSFKSRRTRKGNYLSAKEVRPKWRL